MIDDNKNRVVCLILSDTHPDPLAPCRDREGVWYRQYVAACDVVPVFVSFTLRLQGGTVYVENLTVPKQHRGRGAGSECLAFLKRSSSAARQPLAGTLPTTARKHRSGSRSAHSPTFELRAWLMRSGITISPSGALAYPCPPAT